MELLSRLKRLWELSKYKVEEPEVGNPWLTIPYTEETNIEEPQPNRMATVVQDDPLDIFPSPDEDLEQPK